MIIAIPLAIALAIYFACDLMTIEAESDTEAAIHLTAALSLAGLSVLLTLEFIFLLSSL